MATIISTINESLVDLKVVEALRYTLPMIDMFSHKIESQGRIKDDYLYVPVSTDPSAQSKTAGMIVTGDGTLAGSGVQLSNFYGAGWDAKEGTIPARLIAEVWADKAAGGVYSLAKQVIDAALAILTTTNFGATADDLISFTPADFNVFAMAQVWKLAEKKIKQTQRTFICGPDLAAGLIGQQSIMLATAIEGEHSLANGLPKKMIGMNAATYGGFPSNSISLGGAVVGKAAVLVAIAPPDPLAAAGEGNIVERRIITDPVTGFSCLYTMTVDGGGTLKGEVAALYGVLKGQNSAVLVTTAA